MEEEKDLNERLDKIENRLDRIAVSLEKLSICIDEQEKAVCVKGVIFVSQDY